MDGRFGSVWLASLSTLTSLVVSAAPKRQSGQLSPSRGRRRPKCLPDSSGRDDGGSTCNLPADRRFGIGLGALGILLLHLPLPLVPQHAEERPTANQHAEG